MTEEKRSTPPSISPEQVALNKQRAKEQREQEERESKERHDRDVALEAWRAEGGDPGEFDVQWPELRDEARRRAVSERIEQQRRNSNRAYKETF